jgi:hypothetical protein
MRIYLASTGPSNEANRERGMLPINHRLLSYYHIVTKALDNDKVFEAIRRLEEEKHEDRKGSASDSPRKGEARSG